jgi:hypothetical protein
MFKKILSYLFILFGLVELVISTSRPAMQYISEKRDTTAWWGAYPCLHGDLISLSYLDAVKRFNPPPNHTPLKKAVHSASDNIVLYLHGDSYTYHLSDSIFTGTSAFRYIDRNHGMKFTLDTSKRNVLVIEVSERYIRPYFNTPRMLDEVGDTTKGERVKLSIEGFAQSNHYASVLPSIDVNDLFNKYINQNLQCNLFNYNFIIPIFEYKAALNYYVFNRASGDVVISKDKNFLFLKETVSLTDAGSSYIPLDDNDIKIFVNNFNVIYKHYRDQGFKEVYLSMIPNSASVVQPEGYNNLIPRIQSDPALKMKIIDAHKLFKTEPTLYYLPGDTHWNSIGRQKWIDLVNEYLKQQHL